MVDRVRIQTLREAGRTLKEVAAQVGVSKRAVQMIVREPRVTDLTPVPMPRSHGVGRPSVVEEVRGVVADLLAAEPGLPTVEGLHRTKALGYRGRKSALYALVASLRPEASRPAAPLVRFEGVAGRRCSR